MVKERKVTLLSVRMRHVSNGLWLWAHQPLVLTRLILYQAFINSYLGTYSNIVMSNVRAFIETVSVLFEVHSPYRTMITCSNTLWLRPHCISRVIGLVIHNLYVLTRMSDTPETSLTSIWSVLSQRLVHVTWNKQNAIY